MPRYQITAIGIYSFTLAMNLMRDRTESVRTFGPFESVDQLRAFYQAEEVPPYQEDGPSGFDGANQTFTKYFRKGGPLEWMNPLNEQEWLTPGPFGHGIHETLDAVEQAVKTSPAF